MKYLVVGDVHIASDNRLEDRKKVLSQIVDIAIERKVDKVLWAGDLFDSRHPNPEECNALYETVIKLRGAIILSVLLIGNHDKSKGYSALDVFKKLQVAGVEVVEDRHIENGIFLGHFLVKELVLSNDIELSGVVTAEQLITRYPEPKLFLIGDNHKPSNIDYNGRKLYSLGSIDRCNFGERRNIPRVLFVDTDKTYAGNQDYEIQSIPLDTRPMIQCDLLAFDDILSGEYLKYPNTFDDSIVKVIISGSNEDLTAVEAKRQDLREFFKSAYSLSIQYSVTRKEIVRDSTVTEDMNEEAVLQHYLEKKRDDLTKQAKDDILAKGKEIFQQVKDKTK
jgi:DNA repair exonuclease SbcCD nuclease subunit